MRQGDSERPSPTSRIDGITKRLRNQTNRPKTYRKRTRVVELDQAPIFTEVQPPPRRKCLACNDDPTRVRGGTCAACGIAREDEQP